MDCTPRERRRSRDGRTRRLNAAALAAATFLCGGCGRTGTGEPQAWVPDSPRQVVLELPSGAGGDLATLRRALSGHPRDAATASRYAQLALQHYAATGDARYLGYAAGALDSWSGDRAPPRSIWLLRGRILQTQHRFEESAAELERLLEQDPGVIEARLLAADARRRNGNIARARAHCAALIVTGQTDLAQFCAADILLSLGEADRAFKLASLAAQSRPRSSTDAAQWMLAVVADAAAASDRTRISEDHYRRALLLPGPGIALHVAYADLLLRDGRPDEALETLAGLPTSDAVLLRRAMAAKALKLPAAGDYREELARRFEDEELLGITLHQRERAMFELYVREDPQAALAHAKRNWRVQKGPEDAAILMRAARAADRPDAARIVLEWRRRFLAEQV